MTWVRRTEPPPPTHGCGPPQRYDFEETRYVADGGHGDLWRCDVCGRLWRVVVGRGDGSWKYATWWQRLRHLFVGLRPAWPPVPYGGSGQHLVSTAMIPPPADRIPDPPPSGGCRHDH